MGINALLEMGNLEKPWVISCLSLPFHSGAPIPELDWHGGREVGNSWPLLSTKVYVPQTELYSWKVAGDAFGVGTW